MAARHHNGPISWLVGQCRKGYEEMEKEPLGARVVSFLMFIAVLSIGMIIGGSLLLNIYFLKGGQWPPW